MPPLPRALRVAACAVAVLAAASLLALTADAASPPPALKLTIVPQSASNDPQPVIGWSQNFVAKKISCTLDGHALSPCKSQHHLPLLATGRHSFAVTAVAPSGKTLKASAAWLTDLVAPGPPTVSTPAGWSNAPVTLTAAGSTDTGGAGLAGYEHRTYANGVWGASTPGGSMTISAQDQTEVAFRSVDRAGNRSDWVESTVLIDTIAPALNASADPSGYTQGSVTLTGGDTDGGSGISSDEYQLSTDGGLTWSAPQPGDSVDVTREGQTIARFRATDNAGNTSGWAQATARIDTTPPDTHLVTAPPSWANGPVTVTASSSDAGSGIASTAYETTTDGGTTWSAPQPGGQVTVSNEGVTLVRFHAIDMAGNTSDWVSATVSIDTISPMVIFHGIFSGWSDAAETLSAETLDPESGIASTEYQTSTDNGATWSAPQPGARVTVSTDGVTLVRFRATDNAGNTSDWRQVTAQIDTTAPTVTINGVVSGWSGAAETLTAQTSDLGSGIASTDYETSTDNGANWSVAQRGVKVDVSAEGVTLVRFRATDNAGNTSAWTQAAVQIDTGPPTVTINGAISGWSNTPQTVTAVATDTGSGVATVQYSFSDDGGTEWSAPQPGSTFTNSFNAVFPVRFRAIDNAGHISDWTQATVRVDMVAPTVTVPAAVNGYWTANGTLTAKATDATSGVAATEYETSADGGNTWTGPQPGATVTATDGATSVRFRATDNAGNTSAWTTTLVDVTGPVMTVDNFPYFRATAERVEGFTDDPGSGGASVEYEISTDGGATWSDPTPGWSVLVTRSGITLVRFRGTDKLGNTGDWTVGTARVDTVAPTLTITGEVDGWASGPVTLGAQATDADSGVLAIESDFSTDPTPIYSGDSPPPVTVTHEGTTLVRFIAYDKVMNSTGYIQTTVRIDTKAPTVTVENAANGWLTTSHTVTADAVDAGSGVALVEYETSTDGGTTWSDSQSGNAVTVADGTRVRFRATDNLGHVSGWTSGTTVDTTLPTLTTSGGSTMWGGSPVTITAGAADTYSGLLQVAYETSTNGGSTWSTSHAGSSVVVSAEGTTLVRFRATDVAGNQTDWTTPDASTTAMIDTKAPTLAPSVGGWTDPTPTIAANATDTASGVASVQYETSTDGGSTWSAAQPGDHVSASPSGVTTVRFQATDNAGHTSSWTAPISAAVDTTPPTLKPSGGSVFYQAPPVTIYANATDAASGVAQVVYETSADGGTSWSDPQVGTSVTFATVGSMKVRFQATDNAGNVSDWATADFNSTPYVQPPLDIELVVDRTGSMSSDNKMTNLQAGLLQGFLRNLTPGLDNVGLTVFPPDINGTVDICKSAGSSNYDMTNQTYAVVPLSNDYLSSTGVLNPNSALVKDITCLLPGGGTSYTGALEAANAQLQANGRPGVQKVIILLTDGAANIGPNCVSTTTTTGSGSTKKTITTKDQDPQCLTPCHAAITDAQSYRGSGTIVYSILYGDQSDAPYCTDYTSANEQPLITPQSTLMQIASANGYYTDPDPSGLPAIFQSIFVSLPS